MVDLRERIDKKRLILAISSFLLMIIGASLLFSSFYFLIGKNIDRIANITCIGGFLVFFIGAYIYLCFVYQDYSDKQIR